MRLTALATVGLMALSAPALADDVLDAIDEARAAYEDGDLQYAKESLDFAGQLVAQMRTSSLSSVLPEAMEGWTAEDEVSDSGAAMAMFGGGGGAATRRVYTNGDGQTVEIDVMLDSPMIMQLGMVFNNPALARQSGAEMTRFGRQKAMITPDGEVQMLVGNRGLVQVTGSAGLDDKKAYAREVDFKGITNF